MTWVKKDDDWPDQPQWAFADWLQPQDECLYDRLLTWCNRYATDGLVPIARVASIARHNHLDVADSLERLMRVNPVTAEALVEAAAVPGSVFLTGYHVNQPTRQKVIDDAEHIHDVRSAAGKKGAAALWAKRGKAHSKPDGNLPKANMANGASKSDDPVPRTPDPVPKGMYIPRLSGKPRARGAAQHPDDYQTGLEERLTSDPQMSLQELLGATVERIPAHHKEATQ